MSINAAGMAAPPVVVKSSEVAEDVVAMVIAEVLELPESSGLTTAVCPAAQLVNTSALAVSDRNRRRFLVGEVIQEE